MLLFLFIIILSANIQSQDGLVKTFYPDGKIESEINFRDSIREGEAKFYYENGNVREERNYVNGRVDGLVKLYSETGLLKEVFVIEDGKREGPTSLFDENGNYLSDIYFEGGKLVVPSTIDNESTYAENEKLNGQTKDVQTVQDVKPKVVKSKKVSNETFLPPEIEEEKLENDPAFFATAEVMPEPIGGMEAIYKKLFYPSDADKNNVKGVVKIKAFIDEFGEVTDAQIVEAMGYGCDEIARNAIYFAKFKPGLQKGKPVRVMMIIPIEFNKQMKSNTLK